MCELTSYMSTATWDMQNTTVEVELEWMPVRVTSCAAFIGPAIVKRLFPRVGCIMMEGLPSLAAAERPPSFRLPRDCIARSLAWLAQGATACVACRMASETFLHDSPLLNIGV
jgi:hypothetical protein